MSKYRRPLHLTEDANQHSELYQWVMKIRRNAQRRQARYRRERRAKGLCPECGKVREDPAKVHCRYCRASLVVRVDRAQYKQKQKMMGTAQ